MKHTAAKTPSNRCKTTSKKTRDTTPWWHPPLQYRSKQHKPNPPKSRNQTSTLDLKETPQVINPKNCWLLMSKRKHKKTTSKLDREVLKVFRRFLLPYCLPKRFSFLGSPVFVDPKNCCLLLPPSSPALSPSLPTSAVLRPRPHQQRIFFTQSGGVPELVFFISFFGGWSLVWHVPQCFVSCRKKYIWKEPSDLFGCLAWGSKVLGVTLKALTSVSSGNKGCPGQAFFFLKESFESGNQHLNRVYVWLTTEGLTGITA